MRFADGAWRMREGVTPSYASRIDESELEQRELRLHVSSQLETTRGATLEGHMFTIRISAPLPGVLRLQISHHQGRQRRGPAFQLQDGAQPLSCESGPEQLTVRSGSLVARIRRAPWTLQLSQAAEGGAEAPETETLLTESPFRALALMSAPEGTFLREQLALAPGEQIYGLGERFQALARNGQSVEMWNRDCGTCSDVAYKNVPFFLSSRGYGVLVNSAARVSFEIGTEQVMRAQFAVPGEELDYFFLSGPSPKQVLERLGALSGRPALPPAWSFGLWLSTSFTAHYDQRSVLELLDEMRRRELPLHVFHFDCFWMKAHHWCNFRWDEALFPDPPALLAQLAERGVRTCLWINPTIGERSHLFAEGKERGYLLLRPNGDVWQQSRWQAGLAWVDFTNPAARRWFQDQLRPLLAMGVAAFKTDFGDDVPTDVRYFDHSDPERMHNYYSCLYNEAVHELLQEVRGPNRACLFARAATATCQRFPVHWGGDNAGTYASMAETLRGGLSLGLCGFGFWSHDIGGFLEPRASAAVYKRWLAFGLLSSHSRLHGNSTLRVPWGYDEEACEVLRQFTRLKCRLMPYVLGSARQAHEHNVPVLRAMLLEFPDDPACRLLDRQYMLGDALLVAPVFHDREVEYYLPEGSWTHLLSGEQRAGGRWYTEAYDFFSLPLWLRPESVLCAGTSEHEVEYDYGRRLRLLCGKLERKQTLHISADDGHGGIARLELYHDVDRVRVRSSQLSDFQVHLPWARELVELDRGSLVRDDSRAPLTAAGIIVRADSGTASLRYRA